HVREEVRDGPDVDISLEEIALRGQAEGRGYIRGVLEAEVGAEPDDPVGRVAESVDDEAVGIGHMGNPLGDERDDDHVLVDDVVVLDVGAEGERGRLDARGREYRGPGDAPDRGLAGLERPDEVEKGSLLLRPVGREDLVTLVPGDEE